MTDPRQAFLEKYPDVDPRELDALATPQRPRLWWLTRYRVWIAASFLLIVCVLGTSAYRVHHVLTHDADVIAADMVAERAARVESMLQIRLGEGREVASRIFGFGIALIQSDAISGKARMHYDLASEQADSLWLDFSAMRHSPFAAGQRIWKTGPTRLGAVVGHAKALVQELEALVPKIVSALSSARAELSGDETNIRAVFAALDALFETLIDEPQLLAQWSSIANEFTAWHEALHADLELLQQSFDGTALRREFARRIVSALF